jgi:hypothetical protein
MKKRTLLLAVVAAVACGRENPPQSARAPDGSVLPAPRTAGNAGIWDPSLGSVVATPSIESGTPLLFVRDTGNTADLEVELFTHDDQVTRAILAPTTGRHKCAWERSAVLTTSAERSSPVVWSLALAPGVAKAIAVDGVGDFLPRDSAILVARIHRLVNALPDDSSSVPFRGLATVVRDAWEVRLEDSSSTVLAVTTRTLNIESNPRSEVTTIIIEPDPATGPDAWRTAFARRDSGPEDRVEGTDLLAAFRLRDGRTAVAFARENERGLQLDIVERSAPGSWRVRWSSASFSCAR